MAVLQHTKRAKVLLHALPAPGVTGQKPPAVPPTTQQKPTALPHYPGASSGASNPLAPPPLQATTARSWLRPMPGSEPATKAAAVAGGGVGGDRPLDRGQGGHSGTDRGSKHAAMQQHRNLVRRGILRATTCAETVPRRGGTGTTRTDLHAACIRVVQGRRLATREIAPHEDLPRAGQVRVETVPPRAGTFPAHVFVVEIFRCVELLLHRGVLCRWL